MMFTGDTGTQMPLFNFGPTAANTRKIAEKIIATMRQAS